MLYHLMPWIMKTVMCKCTDSILVQWKVSSPPLRCTDIPQQMFCNSGFGILGRGRQVWWGKSQALSFPRTLKKGPLENSLSISSNIFPVRSAACTKIIQGPSYVWCRELVAGVKSENPKPNIWKGSWAFCFPLCSSIIFSLLIFIDS